MIKNVIYVDVDDTFVRSFGTKRIPMTQVIEEIKKLFDKGFELYCWSSGGAEYAKNSANEFGIEYCFKAFLPKPTVLLDDVTISKWKYLTEIHPMNLESEKITLDINIS